MPDANLQATGTTNTVSTPEAGLACCAGVAPDRLENFVRRHAKWLAVLLFLILAIQVRAWWLPGPDATSYLSLSRSVWSGHALTNLGERRLYYAPGYPILVSPAFLCGDQAFLALSAMHLGMGLLVLLGAYVWARALISQTGALVVTLLVGCNVSFGIYYRATLSELAMTMFMIWAAVVLRHTLTAGSLRACLSWAALGMVLMTAAVACRQSSLMVVAGLGVVWLGQALRRRQPWGRAVCVMLLVMTPLIVGLYTLSAYDRAMALQSTQTTTYTDYVRQGSMSLGGQLCEGVRLRISEIGRLLVPGMFKAYARRGQWLDINLLIYIPVTLAVLAGWWRAARQAVDPLLWSMPFYVGLYIVWAWDADTRYFTPILAVLGLSVWVFMRHWRSQRLAILLIVCGIHLAVALGVWSAEVWQNRGEYYRNWPQLREIAGRIGSLRLPVATKGLSWRDDLWLQFLADRQVQDLDDSKSAWPDAGWIVIAAHAPAPDGFDVVHQTTSFQLLRPTALPVPPTSR